MSMNILEYESMEVYTCILPYSCTVILTHIYIYIYILHGTDRAHKSRGTYSINA